MFAGRRSTSCDNWSTKLGKVMIAAIPWREIMAKRRYRSRRAEQTLLFRPRARAPKWTEVSPPVRKDVMALLTKMLRDACAGNQLPSGETVDE